jgi:hypothetical protein
MGNCYSGNTFVDPSMGVGVSIILSKSQSAHAHKWVYKIHSLLHSFSLILRNDIGLFLNYVSVCTSNI